MAEMLAAWRLRYDIVSVRTLVLLAGGVENADLNPDVHLFLGDRYSRLAAIAERRGSRRSAARLGRRAAWHFAHTDFDPFPTAVAMAMPVPRPRIFTDARGYELRRKRRAGAA